MPTGCAATPAMRWVVGDRAITGCAASASQKPARHGGAMDQRGQGRDQMDAAVMPFLRGQCRPPSASCACLQPRQFHANAGDAQGGGAVVTSQPARQADQDRCQGRQPWPLRHLPNGRGRSVTSDVPGNPVADRPVAGTARASVTGKWDRMRQAETAVVRLNQGRNSRF